MATIKGTVGEVDIVFNTKVSKKHDADVHDMLKGQQRAMKDLIKTSDNIDTVREAMAKAKKETIDLFEASEEGSLASRKALVKQIDEYNKWIRILDDAEDSHKKISKSSDKAYRSMLGNITNLEDEFKASTKAKERMAVNEYNTMIRRDASLTEIQARGLEQRQTASLKHHQKLEVMDKKQEQRRENASKNFVKNFGGALDKVGSKIESVGNQLTLLITGPLTILAKQGFDFALEFDEGMNRVSAVTGIAREDLKLLENQATSLGQTSTKTGAEVAQGMAILGLAGKDVNEIYAMMPGIVNMAEIAQIDMAKSSDILVSAMNMFGAEASDASHFVDVMATTVTNAKVDMEGLGNGLKYVGPIASEMGLTFEEVAATLGSMGDKGIDAGMAGRALRMMLVRLAGPTEKAWKEYGDFNQEMQNMIDEEENLAEWFGAFDKHMEGLTKTQEAAFLKTIGGTRAMSGVFAVLGDTKFDELMGEMDNVEGAAEDMRNVIVGDDSLFGAWSQFKSSTEEAQRALITTNEGPIADFLIKARDVINAFTGMNDEEKKFITNNLLLLASIGPVVLVLGKVIGLVGGIVTAIGAYSVATTTAATVTAVLSGAMYAIPLVAIGIGIWAIIDTIGIFKKELQDSAEYTEGLSESLAIDVEGPISTYDDVALGYEVAMQRMVDASAEAKAEIASEVAGVGGQLSAAVKDGYRNAYTTLIEEATSDEERKMFIENLAEAENAIEGLGTKIDEAISSGDYDLAGTLMEDLEVFKTNLTSFSTEEEDIEIPITPSLVWSDDDLRGNVKQVITSAQTELYNLETERSRLEAALKLTPDDEELKTSLDDINLKIETIETSLVDLKGQSDLTFNPRVPDDMKSSIEDVELAAANLARQLEITGGVNLPDKTMKVIVNYEHVNPPTTENPFIQGRYGNFNTNYGEGEPTFDVFEALGRFATGVTGSLSIPDEIYDSNPNISPSVTSSSSDYSQDNSVKGDVNYTVVAKGTSATEVMRQIKRFDRKRAYQLNSRTG